MSKFGFYSDKPAVSFENHLSGLEEHAKALLLDLRDFTRSLGSNVIEEIRPHRIVYAKSLTFRTFLDIQPRNDCLVISIRNLVMHNLIFIMTKTRALRSSISHKE